VGCALAVGLKYRLGFDDSLDVVGVHLVGGLIGTLLIGFLADATNSPTAAAGLTQNDGLFFGGGATQLLAQLEGAFAVLIYSFIVTFIIGWVLHKTMGFTVGEEDEVNGIDLLEHAETAYELTNFAGSSARGIVAARTAPLEPKPTASEPAEPSEPSEPSKEGASA
jgi:Amt family ammonium transporter